MALVLAARALGAQAESGDAAAPALVPPRVPAAGPSEALLTVPVFGRYMVRARSTQGMALALVDRMAGELAAAGEPGREDGRVDVFLDRGAYELRLRGPDRGRGPARGQAALEAAAFRELHAAPEPRLVPRRLVSATLGDLEQRSYWIRLTEPELLLLEGAGRSLADLRLWRDGGWLEELLPVCAVVDSVPGAPLRRCRLSGWLAPGLYRLSAYGGPDLPWSAGAAGDEHPLHLRWGLEELPEAGRRRFLVSPFGEDLFLAPARSNYFRVELEEARPLRMAAGWFDTEDLALDYAEGTAEVDKDSRPPVAEIALAPYEGEDAAEGTEEPRRLLAVRAAPGEAYVLQQFDRREVYEFRRGGPHWVSSVHSGHAGDSIDATALLTARAVRRGGRQRLLGAAAIGLDREHPWARRFNLLAPTTLFLHVGAAGGYEVVAAGAAEARYRLEPFLLARPEDYEPPPFEAAGHVWELDPGYYVLSIEPLRQGVLELGLRPAGLFDRLLDLVGLGPDEPANPVRAATRFGAVELDAAEVYTLHLNRQPGVESGLLLRPWPLDLREALPLALLPGETVEIASDSGEETVLRAETEQGLFLPVAVDGGEWSEAAALSAGAHRVAVRNDGAAAVSVSLRAQPPARQDDAPLPALAAEELLALPDFPLLRPGAPHHLDLGALASATFQVVAERPALYQLESTGLLATAGTLRTRTVPALARGEQNGVGRNFLLQSYLREGDYQLTVETVGSSAGHLGVTLRATPLVAAGELRPGAPVRLSLAAGEGAQLDLHVAEAGDFQLDALGLGFPFRVRLDDADGWPILTPDQPGSFARLTLAAGAYRLVLLPQPVPARAVVVLERLAQEERRAGHGPHPLPLDRRVEHVWEEPAAGDGDPPAERPPDRWRFALPATVRLRVLLGDEMEGRVVRLGAGAAESEVAFVPPGRGWQGELAAGAYELRAVCSRRNNLVRYSVEVAPEEMVAGLEREVVAPMSVPLAVGEEGLVELASLSPQDVRARLFDAGGRLVAAADDRPDDWNFLLQQRLAPGRYRLEVEPVGVEEARLRLTMTAPREVTGAALALPHRGELALAGDVHLLPLDLPAGADFLLVAAESGESVGIEVESRSAGGSWRPLATAVGRRPRLELPLGAGKTEARLRVWSLDRRGETIHLRIAAPAATTLSEADLARGASLGAPASGEPAVAVVRLERPGLFRSGGAARWSGVAGLPLTSSAAGLIVAPADRLWVARDGRGSVTAQRVALRAGEAEPLVLTIPPGVTAFADLGDDARGQGGGEEALLVLAASLGGQPGLAAMTSAASPATPATAMAAPPFAAATVALGGRRTVAVWNAGPSGGETGAAMETSLSARRFAPPPSRSLDWGAHAASVAAGEALRFDLPAGAKRLRLALGPQVAAALADGDRVRSTHWQGGAAFEEWIETEAAALHVFAAGAEDGLARVELLPVGPREAPLGLGSGRPFERRLDRGGWLRLAVDSEPAAPLHVRGAVEEALWLGAAGEVRRGFDLERAGAGDLLLRHRPGLVLVWLGDGEAALAADWPAGVAATALAPPATLALSGPGARLRLAIDGPQVVHLRASVPLVSLVRRADGGEEVALHPETLRLDLYLEGGAEVALRPLAGAHLDGRLEVTATPVAPIGEGLGPPVLLAAGATRLFAFRVERAGPVGAGVRADADTVECEILDLAGGSHGRGVVVMADLEPGDYLLALRAPASAAAPVRARPALAGLELPDTGPPEEVVRQYLAAAAAPAMEAAPEEEP